MNDNYILAVNSRIPPGYWHPVILGRFASLEEAKENFKEKNGGTVRMWEAVENGNPTYVEKAGGTCVPVATTHSGYTIYRVRQD